MTPTLTLALTLASAYTAVGALHAQRDLSRIATVDPAALCSDPCRARAADIRQRSVALGALPPALAALIYMVAGLKWPLVIATRCPCHRKATR